MNIFTEDNQNLAPAIARETCKVARWFLRIQKFSSYEYDDLVQEGVELALELRDKLAPLEPAAARAFFGRCFHNRLVTRCGRYHRKRIAPTLFFRPDYKGKEPRVYDAPLCEENDLKQFRKRFIFDRLRIERGAFARRALLDKMIQMSLCGFDVKEIALRLRVSRQAVYCAVDGFIKRARTRATIAGIV